MKLWLLIGAGVVLIGAFGTTYLQGQKSGKNACQAEHAQQEKEREVERQAQELRAQNEFDMTIALLQTENRKRKELFEKRENDYAARINRLSKDLYDQREEQQALEDELAGRGSSLADIRCARDASGLRRLYQHVFERSAIPGGDATTSERTSSNESEIGRAEELRQGSSTSEQRMSSPPQ